jgi:eukaryotic-like serine/threonine-protein kinase
VTWRLRDGRVEKLGLSGLNGRYSRTGHLLYATTDGFLMAIGMTRDGELRGAPRRLMTGVPVQPGGSAAFDVSDHGTLIALSGSVSGKRRVAVVDSAGTAQLLIDEERFVGWPRVSPDGGRVAFEVGENASVNAAFDEWIFDVRSGTFSRLTTGGAGQRTVGWTSDGRKVLYLAWNAGAPSEGRRVVVAMPADRSGPPDTVYRGTDIQQVSVGPPHGHIAVALGSGTQTRIVVAPLDDPSAVRAIGTTLAHETSPRLSPDGRWLAFTSYESGRAEVHVTSVASAGPRVQISAEGGFEPVWSRRGSVLYYRGPRRMMRATLVLSPELAVVRRDSLFIDSFWRATSTYDVLPDDRFLMLTARHVPLQTVLFVNWPALLSSPDQP